MSKYLTRQAGSDNWYLRLQTNGKSQWRSLGTANKAEAEIRALPFIQAHKANLLATRPSRKLEPWPTGIVTLDDGRKAFADAQWLNILDDAGKVVERKPNIGRAIVDIPGREQIRLPADLIGVMSAAMTVIPTDGKEVRFTERPKVAEKDSDDALFDAYCDEAELSGYPLREARQMWTLFRTLTKNKPLAKCTRDDGRALVAYLADEKGLRSSSIIKKVMWLRSAVNYAISEGKFTGVNPFSKVAKKGDDIAERQPLSDDDVTLCLANLDKLSESDQLLFRIMLTTGMRLSEAFTIASEKIEEGVRFVTVGKKTKQSKRHIPFPDALLRHLPAKITKQLFTGTSNDASHRLNDWLDSIGITDPLKVAAHSLRHRVADKLRAAGIREELRWAILGHERVTVARGYGHGFPVTMLKEKLDLINSS